MEDPNLLNKLSLTIRRSLPFAGIILLAAAARIVPHPANVAPITGLALFSGSHFKKKVAVFVPLLAMLVSDLIIGLHPVIPYVYGSFFIIALIGTFLRTNAHTAKLSSIALLSSLLFFIITNFGVWFTSSMYPKTFLGLLHSYEMGLPFLKNTAVGDLLYTFAFFYGFDYANALLNKTLPAKKQTSS